MQSREVLTDKQWLVVAEQYRMLSFAPQFYNKMQLPQWLIDTNQSLSKLKFMHQTN